MAHRLVLGCAERWHSVVRRLADGQQSYQVIVETEDGRAWLSDRGIPATMADPADPSVLAEHDPESVLVAAAPERVDSIADAAAATFGRRPIRVLVSSDAQERSGSELPDGVEAIDATDALAGGVLPLIVGDASERVQRFRQTVQAIDGRLAVLMHDNPDPDAIASAIAVTSLAESVGTEAVPCYFGEISHQENKALVNLLDLDLQPLDSEQGVAEFDGIALVDHARPGVNDALPESTPIDIVIDHHPPNGPVSAGFVDLRVEAGATSTMLVEYFPRLGVEFDEVVATALLYGIRIDTDDFTREITTLDFEAAATLCQYADTSVLERVESPNVDADTFDTIARAIGNRRRSGSVVTSFVGRISNRDTLAQAADRLLQIEDVETTFVFGIEGDTVYASARAQSDAVDLGTTLRRAFDQIGSAGGHSRMAGAQIPIGILAGSEDDDTLESAVEQVVGDRFFDELDHQRRAGDTSYVGPQSDGPFFSISDLPLGDGSTRRTADEPDDEPSLTADEPDDVDDGE